MEFYTNFYQYKSEVLLRGYKDGQRVHKKLPLKPYLFVNSKIDNAKYRTIYGKPVDKVVFENTFEARQFIQRYDGVSGFDVYGTTNFAYPFINDTYRGKMDYDPSIISVCNIDIEVYAEKGFPYADKAEHPIVAITMERNGRIICFGLKPYVNKDSDVEYVLCEDEVDLLLKFLTTWNHTDWLPDVVTGWNVEGFDIPYIINRGQQLIGDRIKMLSPWRILNQRTFKNQFGQEQVAHEIVGVATLDYLPIYKKFSFKNHESYTLNYIAHEVLGEGKLDYSHYDSLADMYIKDHQLYIEYNIKDVRLVKKLDDKLKMFEQIYAIAYDAKVNFQDALTTVKMWDVIIHNFLIEQNIVVQPMRANTKDRQIEGAYVKETMVGMHKWVVSFDLDSLYPKLIQQYNISPDTLKSYIEGLTVDNILGGRLNDPEIKNYLKDNNLACTATGYVFDKDRNGFLMTLMKTMYSDRAMYKVKMIEAKKEVERVKDLDDKKLLKQAEAIYARAQNMQLAKKIQMNACYGALSNIGFRWYDIRLAESITLSGQMAVRWIGQRINSYLNKLLGTNNDYVIASDTDSMYIAFDKLVAHVYKGKSPKDEEIVEFIDNACKTLIGPYLEKCYKELAEYTNAHEQQMRMKRESIANKGLWLGKKHYVLNVYDLEGVRYKTPEIKMVGIEAVKSSTPEACRDAIKKALTIVMNGTEMELRTFVGDFRTEFEKFNIEDVAKPTSVKGLLEYSSSSTIYRKGCPIHVRAALVYNNIIKEMKLDKVIPIHDGDKMKFCYLRVPNPVKENVIGMTTSFPRELNFHQYIDYEKQFQKTFLKFMDTVTELIGWQIVERATLESFMEG